MRGKVVINQSKLSERKQRFKVAQDYVDNETLRLMALYTPVGLPKYKNSGALRDSGKVQRPGRIVYTSAFARHDYYNRKVNHKHGGNPNATPLWFETTKKKHGKAILRGAAAIVGGKAK